MVQSKLHIGDDILSISAKIFVHFTIFSMKTSLFLPTANPILLLFRRKIMGTNNTNNLYRSI